MIPGKRLGTFRRVTGKAARWILRGDQTIPRGIKTQSGSTMPPLLLQGFPDGAIRIGSTLRVLKKEGRVTYFVGSDSYFSHPETDAAGQRFAMATLLANGHVRASEVEVSGLGIAPRTLMHWTRQLDPKGPGSFYAPRPGRGGAVMTPEKAAQCGRLLAAGETIAGVACLAGVGESTLRKAVRSGRVLRPAATGVSNDSCWDHMVDA